MEQPQGKKLEQVFQSKALSLAHFATKQLFHNIARDELAEVCTVACRTSAKTIMILMFYVKKKKNQEKIRSITISLEQYTTGWPL